MTPHEGFTLFGSFLNFLCRFQLFFKMAGMKILSSEPSLAKLAGGYLMKYHIVKRKRFFQKIMSIRLCTCSSNLPPDFAGICLFHEEWAERFKIPRLGNYPCKVV